MICALISALYYSMCIIDQRLTCINQILGLPDIHLLKWFMWVCNELLKTVYDCFFSMLHFQGEHSGFPDEPFQSYCFEFFWSSWRSGWGKRLHFLILGVSYHRLLSLHFTRPFQKNIQSTLFSLHQQWAIFSISCMISSINSICGIVLINTKITFAKVCVARHLQQ